jgi:hypothetical protein
MSYTLRRCRNAVLHVPTGNDLLDRRIEELVAVGDSPTAIRRIHRGFGRLFLHECAGARQSLANCQLGQQPLTELAFL